MPALLIISLSLQHRLLLLLLQLALLQLPGPVTGLDLHRKLGVDFLLVLESVSPSLQVHVFRIGVIEAALTQFTVESNHLAIIITDLTKT